MPPTKIVGTVKEKGRRRLNPAKEAEVTQQGSAVWLMSDKSKSLRRRDLDWFGWQAAAKVGGRPAETEAPLPREMGLAQNVESLRGAV